MLSSSPKWGLVLLSLLVMGSIFLLPRSGQASSSTADTSETRQKYWIFLTERPAASSLSEEDRWSRPISEHHRSRLREAGVQPLVESRWFHAVSARMTSATRERVEALPVVDSTRPVASGSVPSVSADPLRHSGAKPVYKLTRDTPRAGQSRDHLARINALSPLARGIDGQGVRIGFLDAHFRAFRHPAFAPLHRDDRMLGLRTFPEGRQSGNHGSAVASLAVGRAPGTLLGPAHGAEVLGATTEYTPFERNVEEDYFVAGLEWLQRRDVDVVNVSIGYTQFDDGERSYSPQDLDGDTGITTRAVDRAAQLGVTVVTSAGNSGCDDPEACWYYVNTPADADSAITVGAITPDSTLAPFSSRGPTADGRRKPDVVVQGQDLVAAWQDNAYAQVGGTSFASPQVTGVVAQMLQVNPNLSPMQLRHHLRRTASRADAPDTLRGWGVVNAEAAVNAAEWEGRRNPPPRLEVDPPHPNPATSRVVFSVRIPSGASHLQITLLNRLNEPVHSVERSLQPGPNRVVLETNALPTGLYRYRIETDTGERATGLLAVDEEAASSG